MPVSASSSARRRQFVLLALSGVVMLAAPGAANGQVPLTQIAADLFTNASSQHMTIVEPDTFSPGPTIVAAAQFARFFDGGAADIGVANSTNNGGTWTSGGLPSITTFAGGTYNRVSDPAVAYDARHNVWLISSLALVDTPNGPSGTAVLTRTC